MLGMWGAGQVGRAVTDWEWSSHSTAGLISAFQVIKCAELR